MNQSVFKRRVFIIAILITAVAFFFFLRLSNLHFSDRIILPSDTKSDIRRGHLLDRNGSILAISIQADSLFANPEEVQDPAGTARVLSAVLGLDEEIILRRLLLNRRFIWIKRRLDPETVNTIENMNLNGIHFKKEYRRVYPHRELAANILGFTGIDNDGLEGLEFSLNSTLMDNSHSEDSGSGNNVRLTLDRFIQSEAQNHIREAVESHGAKQGVAAVMEVATGRMLALARYPSFDPNHYNRYPPFLRRNFSVVDSFEPGSTMKIIAAASLLEKNPSILDNEINCTGSIQIGDVTINCIRPHGELDFAGVIGHSCNVGIVKNVETISAADIYSTFNRFGFGRKTDAGVPGESTGILRPINQWSGLSKYSLSIGYEMSVTTLQMLSAFATIANEGIHVNPAFIDSIEAPDGSVINEFYPKSRGRVVDKKISEAQLALMRRAVHHGTGTAASSSHYQTAGKTGTAKKFSIEGGGYTDRSIASFVGIAPYNDPEIAVFILIDNSELNLTGGQIAAPVFSSLVNSVLPYLGVTSEKTPASVPSRALYSDLQISDTMPDLTGMRLPEALQWLTKIRNARNIEFTVSGSGTVYRQSPAEGEPVNEGDRVIINLR